MVLCCISSTFGELSTTRGKIIYVLLTRAPLYRGRSPFSCDLHVLGAPLTFVLSQDQTLQFESFGECCTPRSAALPLCSLSFSFARPMLLREGTSTTGAGTTRFLAGIRTQFSRTEGSGCSRQRDAVSSLVSSGCPELFFRDFRLFFSLGIPIEKRSPTRSLRARSFSPG